MSPKDLIKGIIELIDVSVPVLSTTDNGGGSYTFVLGELKWLRIGKLLTGGTDETFKVKAIVFEESTGYTVETVLVSGTPTTNYTVLNVPVPYYWHGSVRMINSEISKIKRSVNKTPLFYLRTLSPISYNNDRTSRFLYNTDIDLFILDEANYKDWISDDYYTEVIEPLESLMNAFIDQVKKQNQIIEETPYSTTPVIKFASSDSNGNLRKYFTDDLSGWRIQMDLQVKNCLDCCDGKINFKQ